MTKQAIYEFIKRNPRKPFHLAEIVRQLRIPRQEAKRALDALVQEGKLVQTRRKTYGLPEEMRLVVGRISVHPNGFGFVVPEGEGADLFIPPAYLGGAWHNDKVVARPKPPGRDGRPWGEVIRILERARDKLVGTLEFSRGYAILRPDDPRVRERLLLVPDGLEGLEPGARIVVRVRYPEETGEREPFGEFLEYLGQGETPETETRAVIIKYDLREDFPPEVLAEAERIEARIPEAELHRRVDFRHLNVFTIDGADAKDFDDAIHIERYKNGNYRVGIHIADVSHYVPEGSALDREAFERGTSVYLPGRVLPMLPEKLSNGVCSLVPGEDRLVLSVLVDLTPQGEVKRYSFKEGVIRSKARLTYDQVQAFFEGEPLPETARFLEADLRDLFALTQTLKARRLEQGALDFSFTEVKVDVDPDGTLHLIPIAEREARSLIEELMLLANRIVAKHLADKGVPALYRVHEDPAEDRYRALVEALARMGYKLPGKEPDPKALQRVLHQAAGRPEAPAVSMLLLRSLSLARYAPENLGHFGLAFEDYLHFTSPIRRYPDLVVHRVLRRVMRRRLSQKKIAAWQEAFPRIAEHASERERNAEAAERDLTKYYQCKWAEAHKGEVFEGTVSGVTNFGVFVALDNGVEGLLHLSNLTDDYYEYVEEALALIGRHTNKRIGMGDRITVTIDEVNPTLRQIDLAPVEDKMSQNNDASSTQTPRRTRKKRASAKATPKRTRRVVGPPEEPKRNERPVKVTVHKLYFGEWTGESNGGTKPAKPRRARRRRK